MLSEGGGIFLIRFSDCPISTKGRVRPLPGVDDRAVYRDLRRTLLRSSPLSARIFYPMASLEAALCVCCTMYDVRLVLRPWVANSQSIVLAEDIGCFEASQVQQH